MWGQGQSGAPGEGTLHGEEDRRSSHITRRCLPSGNNNNNSEFTDKVVDFKKGLDS